MLTFGIKLPIAISNVSEGGTIFGTMSIDYLLQKTLLIDRYSPGVPPRFSAKYRAAHPKRAAESPWHGRVPLPLRRRERCGLRRRAQGVPRIFQISCSPFFMGNSDVSDITHFGTIQCFLFFLQCPNDSNFEAFLFTMSQINPCFIKFDM